MILCLAAMFFSACELDAEQRWAILVAQQPNTSTPTVTASPTHTPTSTQTPTITPTFTPSAIPTNAPAPTATPIPSDRLALAQRAYKNGDYETARFEFETLLRDPGAIPNEQRLALHWRGRSELQLGEAIAAIATLKSFLQQYPGDELTRAAQFNLGLAYQETGQFEEAVEAYRGSIIPNDLINAYVHERIGDVRFNTAAYTETIAAYQAGIQATDDPGFQVHLREGIAEAELLRNNPAGAIAQYEAILGVSRIDNYRAKILRLAGESHLAAGDPEAAYERYLEAVNRYPQAPDSYLALIELVNAGAPVDEFQRGLVDYYAQAYTPAVEAFERYLALSESVTGAVSSSLTTTTHLSATEIATGTLSSTPVKPAAPANVTEAIWLTGLSWQALGRYNNAINYFQRLIDEYPNDPNWGKAHLEIGKTLSYQNNNISQAKVFFRDFVAKHPNHPLAGEALWRAAYLELEGDQLDEAYTRLIELADTYPQDDYADEALYWAGYAAFKAEDYEKAVIPWAKLFNTYPDSELVNFGGYWQAKALLALNQAGEAEAILTKISDNSLDYYSLRAQDLLTGVQPHSVPLFLPTPTELAGEQSQAEAWLRQWLRLDENVENLSALKTQIQEDPAFQRGQALLDIGLRAEALTKFEIVKDNWWGDPLGMYQLSLYFRDKGLGQLSIVAAARLIFLSPAKAPEDAPLFIQRLFYPIYFEDLIFAEAEKYELDPALLLSIMRQESLFEQSAESIAGARGLMQVMPATGEYVAERSDFGDFITNQLWLPYVSVKFGAWYINQQLGLFEGNQFAALAAYNAGPGNVLEWIRTSDDLDIFVESIPFWESRLYIRRIYVNLAAYRRIYGLSSEASIN